MKVLVPCGIGIKEVKIHLFLDTDDMCTVTIEDFEELCRKHTFDEIVAMAVQPYKERLWQYAVRILLDNDRVARFTYQMDGDKARYIRGDNYDA